MKSNSGAVREEIDPPWARPVDMCGGHTCGNFDFAGTSV